LITHGISNQTEPPQFSVSQNGPIQVICSSTPVTETALITFEGGGNVQPLPVPVPACFTTALFSPQWLTLIEAGAGGTGNFSNEPSPVTIIFTPASNQADITFGNPLSEVNFFYTSATPLTINAFDANNNLVATATGPSNAPPFNVFSPLGVNAGFNRITRITVIGAANQFGIDNLTLTRIREYFTMQAQMMSTP